MDDALGANVADLIRALQGKGIPMPHEVGTFIAWEVCQAVREQPRLVSGTCVFINDQGQVAVGEAPVCESTQAGGAVVHLLGELLVASAPGVPEPVLLLVEQATTRPLGLAALCDELEAALVPLNRGATMRILGRLARDAFGARRARGAAEWGRPVEALTADLDSLLGVDTAAADSAKGHSARALGQAAAGGGTAPGVEAAPSSVSAVGGAQVEPSPASAADGVEAGGLAKDVHRLSEGRGRRGLWLWVLLAFVIVAGGVALVVSRGGVAVGGTPLGGPLLGRSSSDRSTHAGLVPVSTGGHGRSSTSAATGAGSRPEVSVATFRFDSTPRGAQVFGEVAQPAGGVAVELGVAHEFLVRLENGATSRMLVPAEASFADHGRGPELIASSAHWVDAGLAPGPSRLPVTELGQRRSGVGRVTFDLPSGARLFKLIALTPSLVRRVPAGPGAVALFYRDGFELAERSLSDGVGSNVGTAEPHAITVRLTRRDDA